MELVVYALISIVAFVTAASMTQKPESKGPAGLEDIDTPTSREGDRIQVLFGTRDLTRNNTAYMGDVRTEEVHGEGGKK